MSFYDELGRLKNHLALAMAQQEDEKFISLFQSVARLKWDGVDT